MEALEALPSIARLSKTVTRVLGQNPGKFTLQGTNTYLLGERNPYILVDTGEGREDYIPYLQEALADPSREHNATEPYISYIILTHRHHDHTEGLPSVLTLLRKLWNAQQPPPTTPYRPPRIHKLPLPTPDSRFDSLIERLEPGSFTPTASGAPVHDLSDSDTLPVTLTSTTPESDSSLHIIHTPGHTPDSLCIYYPPDRALFTADTVLGHGTSVFEDLGQYMSSLRKMIDYANDPAHAYSTVYPGHGPVVPEGLAKVQTYLKHRVEREEQVLRVLRQDPPAEGEFDQGWTTQAIVAVIYAKYPKELWGPAAHSVELHLKKLVGDGVVEQDGSVWELTNQ
ncbi:Metallo-hydrolase/oxidoreductase [Dichomitus squalens LYAD-421 SS1]|uniref:Metallo-hydrolase/oxidoreductase n=1 Tax=Dichomitus squalens (strain LYAD-421) TaxID=732165 RepID=UPI0004413BD1|nr:Metallo-hydrolase/oxidoreductase [Dichomitus squalens LYAD-421 SS1]EJF62693.1 Metallo-hydrolase/oxidoreductase [Dichomitus squalens LYAD-421 SS1]